MEQREATDHMSTDQREKDRRLTDEVKYAGEERRKGERRRGKA